MKRDYRKKWEQKEMGTEIRMATKHLYTGKCEGIEELQVKQNIFNIHKKLQKVTNVF